MTWKEQPRWHVDDTIQFSLGHCQDNINQMASAMFRKMEVQEDGELTIEQFIQACLMDEEVIYLLRGKKVVGQEEQKPA